MNIGIFTYGTRGDVQPYIALSLGLTKNGHQVTLAAPENFRGLVEGYGINFHPLYGDAESAMNQPEGQKVLQAENTFKLMKYFFGVLSGIKEPLNASYIMGVNKVDYLIANLATLPVMSALAEKQHKKMVLTYFMPPPVPTDEFPLGDFNFMNFKGYNKFTYKLAKIFFWKFVKKDTNAFRHELGLPILKENLVDHMNGQKLPDLFCFSPALIPQPRDWDENHKVTGFLAVPPNKTDNAVPAKLAAWLDAGSKPIYIGFGSNGIGNSDKITNLVSELLTQTDERILFCTGWSVFKDMPVHERLFVTKYVDHDAVLQRCKLGIFHGGAGTLAAMLRNGLPVIILSFYTDQPTWGKIIARRKLGAHIPFKKITGKKIIRAISELQTDEDIKGNVAAISKELLAEDGLGNAIREIEKHFNG